MKNQFTNGGPRLLIGAALTLAALCQTIQAELMHRYSFNDGTVNDSVGTANGVALAGATVSGESLNLNGASAYASLPGPGIAINTYTAATLEIWLTSFPRNTSYTMAAVLGRSGGYYGYQYIMIQPTRGYTSPAAGPVSRVAITGGSWDAEAGVNGPGELNDNVEHFIAVTIDATTISYYLDGVSLGSSSIGANTLANVSNDLVYLGRSNYAADPYFAGSIDEFRIWNNAMDATDVMQEFLAGPNVVPEPSVLALAGLGIISLLAPCRKRSGSTIIRERYQIQ